MSNAIDNMQDVIDSRDIIARIEELEAERESYLNEVSAAEVIVSKPGSSQGDYDDLKNAKTALYNWTDENGEELDSLKALAEQCEGYGDWEYGEALIRDTYFVEYAQELADDIGAVDSNLKWPYTCIDWEQAARELQYDYTCVEFDGIDYWMRS